ncbi:helix-turn-helix domain-containing protein [Streptomyces sp. NPDC002870]|uniref:helix-turn-helix domain-containing protein n=1 Tax=Streptomyces sp. NPDC002870 TaxID=3364666 RepID=UPI00368628C8
MATPEAEEFAALLRELKDRSGRSYGVLAGKLHVSTSTLHRYCNGDAVPTEYAPVERLARLCGATPEELVEIHRRWILADAARKRGRAEVPQEEPQEVLQGAPQEESPDVAGEDPAPDAPAPAPARGPKPGRRRVAIAAAAVVALATVAVSAAFVNGSGSDGGKRTGSAGAVKPSASASASASVSASRSASASASASGPSASPSASRTASTPAENERPPLTVDVRPYTWLDPCSQNYVVDRPPGQVPPPPSEQGARGWVTALGGVPAGDVLIDLSAQSTGKDTVLLQALHVRVVETSEPLKWNAYGMGVGCGGEVRPQSQDINLDAARPRPVPVAGVQGDKTIPATDFPYKVATGDPQVLKVTAHTNNRHVRWYLELEWSSGDRSGTLRIDDRGQPFATSALTRRPAYDYPLGGSDWIPRAADGD